MKVTFIPDDKAGVALNSLVEVLSEINTRRTRKVNHGHIAVALRLMNVIDKAPVTFISKGVNSVGQLGLFIGQSVLGADGFHSISGAPQDAQTRT